MEKALSVPEGYPAGMRVLAVDDDPIDLSMLEEKLCLCGYQVTTKESAVEAVRELQENPEGFDLVMTSVHTQARGTDGFDLLKQVKHRLPVILFSGELEAKMAKRGILGGACDFLLKPLQIGEIRNIWQHVVRRRLNATCTTNTDLRGPEITPERIKQSLGIEGVRVTTDQVTSHLQRYRKGCQHNDRSGESSSSHAKSLNNYDPSQFVVDTIPNMISQETTNIKQTSLLSDAPFGCYGVLGNGTYTPNHWGVFSSDGGMVNTVMGASTGTPTSNSNACGNDGVLTDRSMVSASNLTQPREGFPISVFPRNTVSAMDDSNPIPQEAFVPQISQLRYDPANGTISMFPATLDDDNDRSLLMRSYPGEHEGIQNPAGIMATTQTMHDYGVSGEVSALQPQDVNMEFLSSYNSYGTTGTTGSDLGVLTDGTLDDLSGIEFETLMRMCSTNKNEAGTSK